MRSVRRLLHLILVLALLMSGAQPLFAQTTPPAGPSGSDVAQAELDEALALLDKLDGLILDLQELIDRTAFDLDELEFALGFDAEQIVAFVRDEIAFEQYPGMLRGAQGTLMSRAGNALDQAVLLWTMLSDAGYDARIAHGALSRTQATQLLRLMSTQPPSSPLTDEAAAQEILAAMAELGGAAPQDAAAAIATLWQIAPVEQSIQYSRTISTTQFLLDTLAEAGIELGNTRAENQLRAEAQDYYWVEFRLGPRDEWTQAHPAFSADAAPTDLVAQETFDSLMSSGANNSSLPEELGYRLRVEMAIEQQTGDVLQTIPIIEPWERPVLDLIAEPHTIGLFADGFADTADYADPNAAYTRTRYYFPLLDGELPPGALFFDLEGNVLPPEEAASPFAQLAGAVGGVVEDAAGMLDGMGEEESSPEGSASEIGPSAILNAAWLDYTLVLPDGSEKAQRRIIWERDAPEDISDTDTVVDPLEAGPALNAQYTWMTAVGRIPPGYRLDRVIGEWLDMRPFLEVALAAELDPQAAVHNLDDLPPPINGWSGHLVTFAFFDELPTGDGAVRFRSEPLLVQHKQSAGTTGISMAMDVVFNGQRAYRVSRGRVRLDAAAALMAGVWETETEGLLLPNEVAVRRNTMGFFAAAVGQRVPLRVFTPGESGELFDLFLGDSHALTAIQRDLDAGYAVVVPEFMPDGVDYVGWWRIDPQTGETLGMIDNGAGGTMVEYLLVVSQASGAFICYGISAADSNGFSLKDLLTCWLAAAAGSAAVIAGFATGAALGVIIGAAIVGVLNSIRTGISNNTSL